MHSLLLCSCIIDATLLGCVRLCSAPQGSERADANGSKCKPSAKGAPAFAHRMSARALAHVMEGLRDHQAPPPLSVARPQGDLKSEHSGGPIQRKNQAFRPRPFKEATNCENLSSCSRNYGTRFIMVLFIRNKKFTTTKAQ